MLTKSQIRVLLERLRVAQLVKNFPPFMKLEDSLPSSQGPATGPYPAPDASSPHFSTPILHSNITLSAMLRSSELSWEDDGCTASQEISLFLGNLKAHYRVCVLVMIRSVLGWYLGCRISCSRLFYVIFLSFLVICWDWRPLSPKSFIIHRLW